MWDRRRVDMAGGWSGECDVYAGTLFVHPYPRVNPIFWTIGHLPTGSTLANSAGVFGSLDDAKEATEIVARLRNDWSFRSMPDEIPSLLQLGAEIRKAIVEKFGPAPIAAYDAGRFREQFDQSGYGYRNNWKEDL